MLAHIISLKVPQFPGEMDDSITTFWKRNICPSNLTSCTEVLKSDGLYIILRNILCTSLVMPGPASGDFYLDVTSLT